MPAPVWVIRTDWLGVTDVQAPPAVTTPKFRLDGVTDSVGTTGGGSVETGTPLRRIAGSPKNTHDRRTSRFATAPFAAVIASPSVACEALKTTLYNSSFITPCGSASVRLEEAQTATAPPLLRSSVSARLSSP